VTASPRTHRTERIRRLLRPASIAVVGANDRLLSALAIPEIQRSAATVSLVSRTQATLYGQKTFASLAGIGEPVDTVFVRRPPASAAAVSWSLVAVSRRQEATAWTGRDSSAPSPETTICP
jgi:predicted CoA-binding protein